MLLGAQTASFRAVGADGVRIGRIDEALRRGYNLPPGVDGVEVNEEHLAMFGPDDEWLVGGDTPALLRGGITFEAVRPREVVETSN